METKEKVIGKMKETFGSDLKRISHALKVLNYSEEISLGEKVDNEILEIVVFTAILHDIGISQSEKKYNSSAARYQEIEGPPIARSILEELEVAPEIIERVCYIIGGHHTASKINGLDFQIIWEADLIVNIEEEGLDKNKTGLSPVIAKNFKTYTGTNLAKKLYL